MRLRGKNQLHGKFFENLVKDTYLYGKEDGVKAIDAFDIKSCSETGGVPVSIKMTKTGTIGLADACRIFMIEHDFRMVVARYKQEGEMKVVTEIIEFNITGEEWRNIKGDIPNELVFEFRECIKMFPSGSHEEARKYASSSRQFVSNNFNSKIALCPKIDSKSQRRLQCSIGIETLKKSVKNWYCYNKYSTGNYRGLVLPFSFFSPTRKLRKNEKVAA